MFIHTYGRTEIEKPPVGQPVLGLAKIFKNVNMQDSKLKFFLNLTLPKHQRSLKSHGWFHCYDNVKWCVANEWILPSAGVSTERVCHQWDYLF